MNTLTKNCSPFIQLGKMLQQPEVVRQHFDSILPLQYQQNPWFTPFFVRRAIENIADALDEKNILAFVDQYQDEPLHFNQGKKIAVIPADNTPLDNFFDLFHILISGNTYIGKLPANDRLLLPAIAQLLIGIEPTWKERILFAPKHAGFDAIIADCTDEKTNILQKYFEKYPHIIRNKRSSLAILTGKETDEELRLLAEDIYLYFGLGNQSVTKLLVPKDYDFVPFLQQIHTESQCIADHNQYLNNLDYQKAIRLINKLFYMDAGTFLLLEDDGCKAPISVVYYEYYSDIESIKKQESILKESYQNIMAVNGIIQSHRAFGQSNRRRLHDYTNDIDTMQFLGRLS